MTGGGTSSTSYTMPSPFDADKAKTAELMKAFIIPNLQAGMKGQSTPGQRQSVESLLQAQKYNAGRFGQEAGNPMLENSRRMATESLTMPDKDMLAQAMRMYGLSDPKGSPSTVNETTQHTNFWDYLGGVLGIAKAAYGGK